MPTELPSAEQLTEEVEMLMSLDQQVSIQGQELAEVSNEIRLNKAKVHFMDIFEWVKAFWTFLISVWCIASSYL